MGRMQDKWDQAEESRFIHERNQHCSAVFLETLIHHHGAAPVKLEEPEVIEPLQPIPNEEIARASDAAFPQFNTWGNAIVHIQKTVCAEYGVKLVDLCSQRRHHPVLRPRQVAMYLCRELTNRSFPEIGRRFGGRDHSTVFTAVQRVETLMKSNPEMAARVNRLEEQLGAALG